MREPDPSRMREMAHDAAGRPFFRSLEIVAPPHYNSDFLIRVNDAFAFVPIFSADGAPGFSGSCVEWPGDSSSSQHMRLPRFFQGYISI